MFGKSQTWVGTDRSAQSPFQKLNFGHSCHKLHKTRPQVALAQFFLLSLLFPFNFFRDFLCKQLFPYNSSQSTSNFSSLIFQ